MNRYNASYKWTLTDNSRTTPIGGTSLAIPSMVGKLRKKSQTEINTMVNHSIVKRLEESVHVVGGYSHDFEGNFFHDDSSLYFLRSQFIPTDKDNFHLKVNMDLNLNTKESQIFDVSDRRCFLNMLTWLAEHYNEGDNEEEEPLSSSDDEDDIVCCNDDEGASANKPHDKFDVDFVCLKNVLSKIYSTPYSTCDDYTLYATRMKGKIYLMKERSEGEEDSDFKRVHLANWGHKFKDYVRKGKNPKNASTANDFFRGVIKGQFGRHKVMFSSKLDVADENEFQDDYDNLDAFIMLKSVVNPSTPNAQQTYARYKLFPQYMEMLVTGVPKVVTGYRTKEGVVEDLKLFKKMDLINMAEGQWSPVSSLEFLDEMLTLLKSKIIEDQEVWKIQKLQNVSHVIFSKFEEKNYMDFLPDWYLDFLKNI